MLNNSTRTNLICAGVATVLAIGLFVASGFLYNHGHCIFCHNGEYELLDVVGRRHGGTAYIYECNNCHFHLELGNMVNFFIVELHR